MTLDDVLRWQTVVVSLSTGFVTAAGAAFWARRKVGLPLQELLTKIAKVEYLVDGTPLIADPLTGTVLQQARPGIAVQVAMVTEAVVGESGLVAQVTSLRERMDVVETHLGIGAQQPPAPQVVIHQTLPPAPA